MSNIYMITNLINNKIYIGKNIKNDDNYFGSGKLIKYAIQKYGKKCFKKEILAECSTETELNKKEKYFIKKFNSFPPIGYNISDGGEGGFAGCQSPRKGKKLSVEHKEKISIGVRESLKRPEVIENKSKFADRLRGKSRPPFTKEWKNNMIHKHTYTRRKFQGSTMEILTKKYGYEEANKRYRERYERYLKTSIKNNSIKRGHDHLMYGTNQYNIWLKKFGEEIANKKLMEMGNKLSEALKGRKFSKEHKENLKNSMLNRPKETCVYCGIKCSLLNLIRWHNDKCKWKNNDRISNKG